MMRKTLIGLCLAGLVAGSLAAQTADELVEKNIAAKGGKEKLAAIQGVRVTAKMAMQGMEMPITMEQVPPAHKVRMDFTVQGMQGTRAYDGKTGWQVMPFMGKTDPETLNAEDLKEVQDSADFQGPLFDYKAKGNTVELLGKSDLEGTPAYKLKLTKKNGDVTTIYLDADSYLELRTEASATVQGQQRDVSTTFGDYKKVEGLTLPFSIETKITGIGGQTITVAKYEINPELPASRFEMPKVAAKPAAPPKP